MSVSTQPVPLGEPILKGRQSLEEALYGRRSSRDFSREPVSRREVGQLLWAAQGVTDKIGLRTCPSAGAVHALETFAADSLGCWRYLPKLHALESTRSGDRRRALSTAAPQSFPIHQAPILIVIAAVPKRLEPRFGARAVRFALMESGHAAQNLLLEATALGLAAVPLGLLDETRVAEAVGMAKGEEPCYIIPVGRPLHRG